MEFISGGCSSASEGFSTQFHDQNLVVTNMSYSKTHSSFNDEKISLST
jgi:hypothetical protein